MKFNTENSKPITNKENLRKWEEPFQDLLDEIYYPGYSTQLMEEDPENYQREYFYFITLYDSPM